jgi:hypothetical protein
MPNRRWPHVREWQKKAQFEALSLAQICVSIFIVYDIFFHLTDQVKYKVGHDQRIEAGLMAVVAHDSMKGRMAIRNRVGRESPQTLRVCPHLFVKVGFEPFEQFHAVLKGHDIGSWQVASRLAYFP